MFTGIITGLGTISAIENMAEGKRITLACDYDIRHIPLGASIACDGACMTVVDKEPKLPPLAEGRVGEGSSATGSSSDGGLPLPASPSAKGRGKAAGSFTVEVSPESLACTTLGEWREGSSVNLERPVAVGGEFGGHFVTGHVDAVGEVVSFEAEGDFWRLTLTYPESFGVYLAEKGSVAVNGVSLTVNRVERQARQCSLMIIPHTLQETNLGELKTGSNVNLEADLIARYLLAQREESSVSLPPLDEGRVGEGSPATSTSSDGELPLSEREEQKEGSDL